MVCHCPVELNEHKLRLTSELLDAVHCGSFRSLGLDLLLGLLYALRNLGYSSVLEVVLVVLSLNVDECVDFVEFHRWFLLASVKMLLMGEEKAFQFFVFLFALFNIVPDK
jgi:hypothetical protein